MLCLLLRPHDWLALLDWDRKPNPGGGPPLDRRIPPDEATVDLASSPWRVAAQHATAEWGHLIVVERNVATTS